MSQRDLEDVASTELEAAGFFVERERRRIVGARSHGDLIADITAWGANVAGDLSPELVVEVKAKLPRKSDGVLAQLSRMAASVGARRAFVFDGSWHEADASFTRFETAKRPIPEQPLTNARVSDSILERAIWQARDESRGRVSQDEDVVALVLRAAQSPNTSLSQLCTNEQTRLAVARLLSNSSRERAVPRALADVLVRLLEPHRSDVILDPNCGFGSLLWAVAAHKQHDAHEKRLCGWCASANDAAIATTLSDFCGTNAAFNVQSFMQATSKSDVADRIIALLPFNGRLKERVQLTNGADTSELDVAMFDRVTQWLSPGGRAVLAVAPHLLFADSAEPVRARLGKTARIVTVIELPRGVLETTNIPIAIVVIERSPPTNTLVARLRSDWLSQLSDDGDFFHAYEHLGGVGK